MKEVIGFVSFLFIVLVITGWFSKTVDQRCVDRHDKQNRIVTTCK